MVKTFMVWMRYILKVFGRQSSQTSKTTIQKWYNFDDIPLRVYLKISETNNYKLLLVEGEATDIECEDRWKTILEENGKQTDNLDFYNYLELVKTQGFLVADYNEIKASLLRLLFAVDHEIISSLKEKGYVIDTSSNTAYKNSLMECLNSVNSISNRIHLNESELQSMVSDVPTRKVTYEMIKAHLTVQLGFNVEDDMTLALYREYKTILNNRKTKQIEEE